MPHGPRRAALLRAKMPACLCGESRRAIITPRGGVITGKGPSIGGQRYGMITAIILAVVLENELKLL